MCFTAVIVIFSFLHAVERTNSSIDSNYYLPPSSSLHHTPLLDAPARFNRSSPLEQCIEDYRIVGGQPAHITEAPYQVGIRKTRFPFHSAWRSHLFCGGSLIGPRLVLTAAHCFNSRHDNPHFYQVTLGSTQRNRKTIGAQERSVEKLILHPEFSLRPKIKFDVALVVLDREVQQSEFIKFVELASTPAQENTQCLITGWGREDFYTSLKPNCLMKASVPILNLEECRRRSSLTILDGFLCAGYFEGGIDACSGDSGGPLVCNGLQYGIVSYGKGCAEWNNPGIYTDVYQNLEWIRRESVNGGISFPSSIVLVITMLCGAIIIYRA